MTDGLDSSMVESRICGVGINFRADKTGALYVSSLVENGPADKTGKVRPGDVLYEVDGTVVYRSGLSQISKHLLGGDGTIVMVGFLREGKKVSVEIVRKPVQALMTIRHILEDEEGLE
ncbi:hypothetical protein GUITHDRAFT_144763 [Guillardia theta CCMP2712]|uniref:PDZ domain-containing protein n=1 Tax=Guillardia theta (strain CCMP2712) TaxID=905079 RepID=L1IP25_GUITC|nr:hypothetical protein GUITHDRAFT_144763 [Guillardia theta CCMP2712]EKX37797.1 hypothetical protein GUITHDRAFT_144763 [Guillardia theta CCMP2712]|eukprot:XP_005824777.1 hypothetical protein GUITHDRAFT_144763 [Guillardia theta CCMP2712]